MKKNITLEEIYSLYAQDLYRYIYSLCKHTSLAEDIVQETFYRAYFYVESYNNEKIKPWLFKVAYHTFIDLIRKEKRVTYYDNVHLIETDTMIRSTEEEYFVKKQIQQWFNFLDLLPLQKKNIVLLKDYYQFSYEEIAEIFNISVSNVKITLFRARKELQQKMKRTVKEE